MTGLAFPYNEDFPAGFAQLFQISPIAFNISVAFYLPEFYVRSRPNAAVTASMYMPETAVNKDYLFVFDQNDIRVAGQVFAMQRISIPNLMNY